MKYKSRKPCCLHYTLAGKEGMFKGKISKAMDVPYIIVKPH